CLWCAADPGTPPPQDRPHAAAGYPTGPFPSPYRNNTRYNEYCQDSFHWRPGSTHPSAQNEILVFRMLREVIRDRRTNNIHLKVIFTRPPERSLRQRGGKTHSTQFFGNLRMDQGEHFSR